MNEAEKPANTLPTWHGRSPSSPVRGGDVRPVDDGVSNAHARRMTFDEVTRTDGKQITSADIARVVDAHERLGRTVVWPPVYVPMPNGAERFIFAFRDVRQKVEPAPSAPGSTGGFSF